ncbi:MAG: hypothetical protein WD048_07960 [Chitinophagales bacterium]
MKKVLLITYFFPPGNFAGSYRMKAWAEHLHKFGYYPIVVTRHWADNETDFTAISNEKETTEKIHENYTVYRLPYYGTFRDRLIKKYGDKARFIGKIFSFFQLIAQNYFLRSIPFVNLYDFARNYLIKNPDIKIVLTSGRLFHQFQFCYLLKKEFPRIEWVADYRDPWNTNTNNKQNLRRRFFENIERKFEKKWTSSCAFFTSCSEGFVKSIKQLVNKEGYVITNGFEKLIDTTNNIPNNKLTIAYIGNLYPTQKIEVFLSGYKKFLRQNPKANIILDFWGISVNIGQKARIAKNLKGFKSFYNIKPWVKKETMMVQVRNADCFLICGIPERKGTHSAKFFDYLSLKKPIILSPSDRDVLETTISETNTGFILDNTEAVFDCINFCYKEWLTSGKITYQGNESKIMEYTYENQVSRLGELLSKLNK